MSVVFLLKSGELLVIEPFNHKTNLLKLKEGTIKQTYGDVTKVAIADYNQGNYSRMWREATEEEILRIKTVRLLMGV